MADHRGNNGGNDGGGNGRNNRVPVQSFSGSLLSGPAEPLNPEAFRHVLLRVEPPVARLTLNRPEHNLLDEPMLREIASGLESLAGREDVKAVVMDSAAKVFCGGMDVREYTPERAFQVLDAFHAAC